MTTETLLTKELFTSLDETSSQLLQLISLADSTTINTVPFENSWTATQLALHVTKSNKAIGQALKMEGKAAERNPGERVQELKEIFLDFATKFQSPEFILPFFFDIYRLEDGKIKEMRSYVVEKNNNSKK